MLEAKCEHGRHWKHTKLLTHWLVCEVQWASKRPNWHMVEGEFQWGLENERERVWAGGGCSTLWGIFSVWRALFLLFPRDKDSSFLSGSIAPAKCWTFSTHSSYNKGILLQQCHQHPLIILSLFHFSWLSLNFSLLAFLVINGKTFIQAGLGDLTLKQQGQDWPGGPSSLHFHSVLPAWMHCSLTELNWWSLLTS